ncbi:hypothetical protein [Streptomyces noursei]|uniref:hypothetical protein n=1 Tax=Streptomyces noursei TaxID=1971 RepID=UPI0016778870|nr:hypothetical protein [Streptomyces noursei]MCZ1014008.1 hypothetical protein [Streptomyces noursei]GGX49146.1 hypothetical protein GCM10010341_83480 [Streptomyces noursei]
MQPTDTAQFDHLTMLAEWRDALADTHEGDQIAVLIATAAQRHAALFRDTLGQLDLVWDDMNGTFTNSRAAAGFDRVLDYEDLDSLWRLTFEQAADELL